MVYCMFTRDENHEKILLFMCTIIPNRKVWINYKLIPKLIISEPVLWNVFERNLTVS